MAGDGAAVPDLAFPLAAEPLKFDDDVASTKSGTSHPSQEEAEGEGQCTECGVTLLPDTPAACNGRTYCDLCWLAWGGHACQEAGAGDALGQKQDAEEAAVQEAPADPKTEPCKEATCKNPLCFECGIQLAADVAAAPDGMNYCTACWRLSGPLPAKRAQPRRRPATARAAAGAAGGEDGLELRPTFAYAGSMDLQPPLARFDVRDEICLQVGGFRHGQVVCDSSSNEFAVVGVRRGGDGRPLLWLQPRDLGRPGAGAFPGCSPEVLRTRLFAAGTAQPLREARLEDFDEAEDSDGETVLLCRHCRLPVGDFAYEEEEEGQGHFHGECMAQLLLERARGEERERLRKAADLKQKRRQEHGLGWRPERIPSSTDLAASLGCLLRQRGMCCLVLDEDSGSVTVKETFQPAAALNLEYLSLALQVRRRTGSEPYFSLDPVKSSDPSMKHRTQVKRFEPEWLAATSVGAVLFQSDYHLKELSMGEYEQPVVGMNSCFDLSDGDWAHKDWNAREWFIVRQAEVVMSEDSVLIPRVTMGVEAREQEEGPHGLMDKLLTRPGHPLVKYAEDFTHNFDLIAERKSVIYHLRELAKAAVVAKFLDDSNVALEESWFDLVPAPAAGASIGQSLEIPQLWNERCRSRIEVEAGRIVAPEDRVGKGKRGVYGGVQFGLEEAVTTGAFRPRGVPGRVLPEFMTIRMPTTGRVPRGVDLNLGKFDLSSACHAAKEAAVGSWANQSSAGDQASAAAFWSSVEGTSAQELADEDRLLLKEVFNPCMSDRRAEGERFAPPDASAHYVRGLRQLIQEEQRVRAQRKKMFLSTEFSAAAPGSLFPASWAPACEAELSGAGAAPAGLRRHTGKLPIALQDLSSLRPEFDKCTEDGARFRIYRHSDFELRTTQDLEGAEEVGCVLLRGPPPLGARSAEARSRPRAARGERIVKATEYVEGPAAGHGRASNGPLFGSYVVLETEQGHCILTEQLESGATTWQEAPEDMESRSSRARVVRTAACCHAEVTVEDLLAHRRRQATSAGASRGQRKRYAQAVFAVAKYVGDSGANSGFWQHSEGLWQLARGPAAACRGREQARAEWQGWHVDWQEEWDAGRAGFGQAGRPAVLAAARLPSSAAPCQASGLRRHFEERRKAGPM